MPENIITELAGTVTKKRIDSVNIVGKSVREEKINIDKNNND